MNPEFEIYQDEAGDWRWRLQAANGQVIADSAEGYARFEDCAAGIELVKRLAPTSYVRDMREPWRMRDE